MSGRRSKANLPALFVLSTAFIDVLAIPLLVLASRRQHHHDNLPTVRRDSGQAVASPDESKPHRIELSNDSLKLDDQLIGWDQLPEQVATQEPDSKLLVYVSTDADGNGSISSLLRLSATAAEHNFSERVFVASSSDDK